MGLEYIQNFFWSKPVTDFLHRDIFRTKIFVINGWSFLHMFWGFVLSLFVANKKLAFFLLLFYEIMEFYLYRKDIIIGDKEGGILIDAFSDLVFAFGVYYLSRKYLFIYTGGTWVLRSFPIPYFHWK